MPTLSFKVNADEARRLRTLAREKKVSLSDLIRQRTLAANAPQARIRRVRCPETGALIFAAPRGAKPLTTAAVRELLADFP